MENNNIVRIVLAVVLAVAALVAVFVGLGANEPGAVATSMAVQIPAAVATAIQVGLVALLTAGFTWLFNVFGIDLRGSASVIGLAISAWVVGQLQGLINLTPVQWDPFINALLYLLTLILAPAGLLYMVKRKDNQPDAESYRLL